MEYFGLVFTKHALAKMQERGIRKEDAWETFKHPERRFRGKRKDTFEFLRSFGDFRLTVLAAQNPRDEWITISVWRDPPRPGTADARENQEWKKYKNAGIFGKIFLGIKRQFRI